MDRDDGFLNKNKNLYLTANSLYNCTSFFFSLNLVTYSSNLNDLTSFKTDLISTKLFGTYLLSMVEIESRSHLINDRHKRAYSSRRTFLCYFILLTNQLNKIYFKKRKTTRLHTDSSFKSEGCMGIFGIVLNNIDM